MAPTKPRPTAKSTKRSITCSRRLPRCRRPGRRETTSAFENIRLNDADLTVGLTSRITSLELDQTMDGASTLTLVIYDPHRKLLNSPLAATKSTVTFDAVYYTLVGVEIQDADLSLTFEETAVNVLRQQSGPVKANRYNTTRAQFIHSLVLQPKEYTIPFYAPELNVKQPISGGEVDVFKEAAWLRPNGSVKRSKTDDQKASGAQGGKGQGWITIGATWFYGEPGSCERSATAPRNMPSSVSPATTPGLGPLLAPLFGVKGQLPCGYKLDVEYNGKIVTAKKGDIGSGQAGEPFYKMDMHSGPEGRAELPRQRLMPRPKA